MHIKNVILYIVLCVIQNTSLADNYKHINTFGFDYVELSGNRSLATWLAKRHDWIIGPQTGNLTLEGNKVSYSSFNRILAANKNAKIMSYVPYSSVMPYMFDWMEEWCNKNGHDPEKLYLHYEEDVEVNTTQGKKSVPGYGNGRASNLKDARVMSKWWGGQYPNINPISKTFRLAFNDLVLEMTNADGGVGEQFTHGLFLDSYNATTEVGYWSRFLGKTIELRKLGARSEAEAIKYMDKALVLHYEEMKKYLAEKTGYKDFVVVANGGLAEYMYNDYADLFVGHRSVLTDVCIEELVGSTIDDRRIKYFKDVYDDMESGRRFWIRSQTNYNSRQKEIPPAFIQGILATHYLINHKNGYFFYHEGSPVNYSGHGDMRESHWHVNMEYDIGMPINSGKQDYWGKFNTDRFYVFDRDENSTVLARKYSKGLVLMKFPKIGHGGWNNIGKNKKRYKLDGQYKKLNADNSLSKNISHIELGNAEGVILIR